MVFPSYKCVCITKIKFRFKKCYYLNVDTDTICLFQKKVYSMFVALKMIAAFCKKMVPGSPFGR